MPNIRLEDVARHAGVSMKTVSNVVRNYEHVSAATREKVERAIVELGYRPNVAARRLATGRSGMLALALSDVGLPYFGELASIIAHEAGRRGYRLLLEQTAGDLDTEREIVSDREAGLVDGVIFQPSILSSLEIAQHRNDVPMVLLGERQAPLGVDHVMVDNTAAAIEATRHLIELGRHRIGFVGHEMPTPSATSRWRLEGYREALDAAHLTVDPALLLPTAAISADAAHDAVGAALDAGLRFDALVCRDDLAAIGSLRAILERGLTVPRDVAIVGWDDITMASFTRPALTTIAPDLEELARVALDLLEQRIAGETGLGRHRITGHRLVVRESAPASV